MTRVAKGLESGLPQTIVVEVELIFRDVAEVLEGLMEPHYRSGAGAEVGAFGRKEKGFLLEAKDVAPELCAARLSILTLHRPRATMSPQNDGNPSVETQMLIPLVSST